MPLPGSVTAIAVAPASGPIAAGVVGEATGGLYKFQEGGSVQRLDDMGHPIAVVFDRTSKRMYAADKNSGRILVFYGDNSAVFVEERSESIVGLALSDDSRFLYVVGSSPSTLRIYDTATRLQTSEITLEFTASGLIPISNKAHRVMTESAGEPVWILSGPFSPAIHFVPTGEMQ